MLRESASEAVLEQEDFLEPEAVPAAEARPAWSPARRIAFRFLFAYFFLYIFPFPLEYVPFLDKLPEYYESLINGLFTFVGKAVFGVVIDVQPNGSGDTTWNYVQLFCWVMLALVATVVWSVLDRRRTQYERLNDWLRVYVRSSLAVAMLSYGAFKVIKSQFPAPTLDRLLQPYGDSSPMGLLWTFMGASTAYTFFGGFCEVLGGALLAFRRTILLGALVSAGVLVNIVMLNFSYDVPVKLYSAHLLLMALFLAAPDVKRLLNLFVLNRPVEPAPERRLFARRGLNRAASVVGVLFFLFCFGYTLNMSYKGTKEYGDLAPKPPLYGVWNVEELTLDGQPRPPLLTDETRWRRVVFSFPGRMAVQLMNDSRQGYRLLLDPVKRTMALTKRGETKPSSSLTYQRPAQDVLLVQGTFEGKKLSARLKRSDPSKFLLVSRGFHWINETPFNR